MKVKIQPNKGTEKGKRESSTSYGANKFCINVESIKYSSFQSEAVIALVNLKQNCQHLAQHHS